MKFPPLKLNRRQLVQSSTGLLPLALLPRLAFGRGRTPPESDADARFFLYVQIYGAWDVCLAFDPKNREDLLPTGEKVSDQPYGIDQVRDFGGIPLAPQGQIFGKYADRMAVVNGIDMEVDGGHTPDIIMTGNQTARASSSPYVQAMIAKLHPYVKRRAVPHLFTSYDGQFIGGPYALSSIAASCSDFLAVAGAPDSSESSDTEVLRLMMAQYQDTLPSAAARRSFGACIGAIDSAIAVTQSLKDFGFEAPEDVNTPDGTGNFLGQMFASGVLGSATLSLGSNYIFDTHSNHFATHELGKALIDLDGVIQALAAVRLDENTSVLEKTTIVLTAEYARTPRLNYDAGKDHNIRTNSLVLIGKGVKPGLYGASGVRLENGMYEGHAALPVNFATGAPDAAGQVMLARNVWAGFGNVAGVDLVGQFPTGTTPVAFL